MKCQNAFKGWELGAECFETMNIFTLAMYTRFSLLSKLSRNYLAFLGTRIFSIRFLNEFMLDASRAWWCGWPYLPTPKCCVCRFGYMALQADLMTSNISPQWCFTNEKPAQTSPSPMYLYFHLFPLPLHTLLHLYSSRGRGNGLEEQMFTSWSLWLPRHTLTHWSISHFLGLIVQDVWELRFVPCCSPLLMIVKRVKLESHKCDGGADIEIQFWGLKLVSGQYD